MTEMPWDNDVVIDLNNEPARWFMTVRPVERIIVERIIVVRMVYPRSWWRRVLRLPARYRRVPVSVTQTGAELRPESSLKILGTGLDTDLSGPDRLSGHDGGHEH